MLIGIPMETTAGESRVAVTPETVKKLKAQGHTLRVQSGAGVAASVTDEAYVAAGAEITDAAGALGAEMVLKVRSPNADERALMKPGAVLVGMLNPFDKDGLQAMTDSKLTAFALEAAPRTTRAQSMDVLSSQANLAGYKAVMIAADKYQRIFPMLMTAAGTVKAARVVILGVGVAGLQAIATAKRLGAVIEASDVRPSVKEQVESLGAKFIDVPYETAEEKEAAEGVGGYARPMPQSWLDRQKAEVAKRVAEAENRTGHRNYALAHFLKSCSNLNSPCDRVLGTYFHQCAIEMSCQQLAAAGRFLAGFHPDFDMIGEPHVRSINALMMTAGHYDGSGEFAYSVGIPAKSGVGGGILAVVPRRASIAVWSPGLNRYGNSHLGTLALEKLSRFTGWSLFEVARV